MDNIFISLRDGKVLDVPRGTTALEVAKQISPRLASAALVARVTYGVPPGPDRGRRKMLRLEIRMLLARAN